ncbi:helix-turn-helix transcriptional regulator [uncultured Ruminococcus sp.]|uniref:helix-turn-helix domain-containing protein n=1 Tax=uncultured Ruminococcus sp. TaxID=165186 RepID=UPI0029315F3C|nr:helix-turn-helix transcriptional regulator [uncultured Ruminococcus sp.]
MPLLPGTPGERISDLCNGRHISQKELAKRIGVSAPQLSRIVSGETKTLSSDILIAVAKEFKVSTNYILGLSEVSTRKSYDIFEIGFSEGAAKGLVTKAIDMEILNRLLEHKSFPKLTNLIRIYFKDTAARGIMARNQIIDMATASLSDFVKEHPDKRAEVREDLQFMSAQKLGEHEAEMEKIKNIFLSILRDIKKDIDSGKQPEKTVSTAMIQAIQDEIREHDPKALTKDDVTEIVVNQLGLVAPMGEKTIGLFRKLLKGMMK